MAIVVEQTDKRWKGMQAMGCLGLVLGVIAIAIGWGVFGILSFLGGAVLFIGARVAAWWNHG